MKLTMEQAHRFAGLELNALRASHALGEEWDNRTVSRVATPIHDINGTVLFYRFPLQHERASVGYVDMAADDAMGEPLIAMSVGHTWDEGALKETAVEKANETHHNLKYDSIRFVAYSFPKVAVQFLLGAAEALLLELYSWKEVPRAATGERKALQPSNFERWSFLDELPAEMRRSRIRSFQDRIALWDMPALRPLDLSVIARNKLPIPDIKFYQDTREIHYSKRDTDHVPCYELRGQMTSVWCVAASVEMLLDFYRYSYDQVQIAQELGLGTLTNPNGLPYANDQDVVTVIESLTSDSLDATMYTDTTWDLFRDNIIANQPLISFIPGHSRTVAGYLRNEMRFLGHVFSLQMVLVYDPWPPTVGTITRWENFRTQVYRRTFTSVLKQIALPVTAPLAAPVATPEFQPA